MDGYTVKGRRRQGTNSLDITIPSKVVKEYKISPGDIFKVETKQMKGKLVIEYVEIYKKNKQQ